MKTLISLKYKKAVVLPFAATDIQSSAIMSQANSIAASMMQLGFIPSEEMMKTMQNGKGDQLVQLYNYLIPALKKMVGDDVKYTPMYPNFPKQVMDMSYIELFFNALLHYWYDGEWKPSYDELPRELAFEDVRFKEIGIITEDEFNNILTQLLSSNDSISDFDKSTIKWFMNNVDNLSFPDTIPFKENMCYVAGLLIEQGKPINGLVKTSTDVLRIATALSGGDISLASNTKFKSLSRKQRRLLVSELEKVISEEDINRHRGKWIKLFHNLHVGELSDKVSIVANKIRNNQKIETFNGKVQQAIDTNNISSAVHLLMSRPGEFARKIDVLLRTTNTKDENVEIVNRFLMVANEVSTRVLLQLYGNLKVRDKTVNERVVFPKGNTQHARIVTSELPALDNNSVAALSCGIEEVLCQRFGELEALGNVYVDSALNDCPLPTQQRSASEGLFQVARGTKLPIGDKNTLRFFIYWIGKDIDLSATFHDDNFNIISHVSYTMSKNAEYQSYHSGDIVNAPNGAAEFIDITLDGVEKTEARYISMNVLVYRGPTFAEHKECYAGWMTRDKPNSNEIFDPKTVQQKIDVRARSYNVIPVIFDVVERTAIWTDLSTSKRALTFHGGNNVESNQATISQTLRAIVSLDNKTTLYDLFTMHAKARGTLVDNKDDADFVFSLDGDITPYNITEINNEYVA